MINDVVIEGIVARDPWTYDGDVFFRIASYRDQDRPDKPETAPGRDEPDYVNIRYPGGAAAMFRPQKGQHLRVHGFLQSRDFKETLAEFLEKAKKNGSAPPMGDLDTRSIAIDRNTVEVVAARVIALDQEHLKPARGKTRSKPAE